MTAKKKAPPKKKAVKKKVVKKHAVKKKPTLAKSNGPGVKTARKKKVPAKKKVRARARRLGPVPKYHVDHKSWDEKVVIEIICDRLCSDSKGIAYICRDDDELPDIATVFRWFSKEIKNGGEKPLCDMYAHAKDIQVDFMADEIIEIADNECSEPLCIDGVPVVVNGKTIEVTTSASVQKAKLRTDNRKWIAEKLKHRKYGNKLEVSGDPERPLSTVSDDDLDARIAILQKKADELNQS